MTILKNGNVTGLNLERSKKNGTIKRYINCIFLYNSFPSKSITAYMFFRKDIQIKPVRFCDIKLVEWIKKIVKENTK